MPCENAINGNNFGFIDSEHNSSICECPVTTQNWYRMSYDSVSADEKWIPVKIVRKASGADGNKKQP